MRALLRRGSSRAASLFHALAEWVALRSMMHVGETWLGFVVCFRVPLQKQFRFLATWINLSELRRPSACSGKHLPVRGRLAEASATYTPGLCYALCDIFSKVLCSSLAAVREADVDVAGLECVSVSSLALSLPWTLDRAWTWLNPVHINILESSAVCRLCLQVAASNGKCGFCHLCNFHVALSALSKGRSSSGLRYVCRRSACICLAAGLRPGSLFCPLA